jgi:ADP-ribose pyrophosphatase YjhB (NUDIX family)
MSDRPRFLLHASVAVRDGARVLMVQEEKPESRGKWNLPGGHVDYDEPLVAAAERELREETHLSLPPRGLIGIYQTPQSLRFVFRADLQSDEPSAGDEILAIRFMTPDEILAMPDELLVSQRMLRQIMRDLQNDVLFPLHVLGARRGPSVGSIRP